MCMRASGASELRKFGQFHILKLLFLSIFCWYIENKSWFNFIWGGGQAPPPKPPTSTPVSSMYVLIALQGLIPRDISSPFRVYCFLSFKKKNILSIFILCIVSRLVMGLLFSKLITLSLKGINFNKPQVCIP